MIGIGIVVNGKYRLVRVLGDGGMGTVYEAQHVALGTRAAVKVLHAELARRTGLVERFLQEARVAAQIRSPHVVQVIDVDRTPEGDAYIVMELLEGEPLSSVLERQKKLAVSTACAYTGQILEALEAAHALGVIHRDLKPENVFVTFAGGKPVLKLIDFGIAKARRLDPSQKSLTVAGVIMGTAEYMAPEQARSADQADARSDLYAVGVMLYEMIAGTRPVHGDDARIIALKVERGEVTPLLQAAPDTPRELAGLVHRAMAAHATLRFATATEMRLALEAAAAGRRLPTAGWAAAPPGAAEVVLPSEGAGGPAGASAAAGPGGDAPRVATVRAPPITAAIAPMAAPPHVPAGAAFPVAPSQKSAHSRRPRRAPWAWLALVVLALGGVAAFVLMSSPESGPVAPVVLPAASPPNDLPSAGPATIIPSAPGGPAASRSTDVPSLTPTKALPPPARPLPSTRPSAHPATDAGLGPAPSSTSPLIFPPALPSVLPPFPSALPFPSGFPTSLPSAFPSVFPPVFPGWPGTAPSSPPSSTPAASPSASGVAY